MAHLFIYLLLQVNQQRKQNKLEGMGRNSRCGPEKCLILGFQIQNKVFLSTKKKPSISELRRAAIWTGDNKSTCCYREISAGIVHQKLHNKTICCQEERSAGQGSQSRKTRNGYHGI